MPTLLGLDTSLAIAASDALTPQVIDSSITVNDAEENWQGGSIVISGLLAGDTVSIANIGIGAGQISVVGSGVYYQNALIGAFGGGVGASLTIALLTGSADSNAAIEALLAALRFSTTAPLIVTRDLTYTLTDGAADTTIDIITVGIAGDAAANHIKGTGANNTLDGAGGNDLLRGEGGDDNLVGALGDDNLVGGTGDDTLVGGDDNDTLNGGAGDDEMYGGVGNDTYYVDAVGDAVLESPGEGTDTVRSSINYALGAYVENLLLVGAATEGHGNGDNNTVTGNTLDNDLYGEGGDDTLNGNAGDDYLEGGAGIDTLNGSTDDDILSGGGDNDILRGGAGSDSLNGEGGADNMDGGTGDDTYYVDDAGDVVAEAAMNGGNDTVSSTITFTLAAGIENLILTGADDIDGTGNSGVNRLEGNTGQNVLSGGDGNDALLGYDGADDLVGGAGADSLDGGDGADDMAGGTGNDRYYVDNAGDVIVEAANEGYDRAYIIADYVLAAGASVEELYVVGATGLAVSGNELNNLIFGDSGDDTLLGFDGDDRLDGGLGADGMAGGTGDDRYYVDDSGDTIVEADGEGYDRAYTTADFVLGAGASVEDLYVVGATGLMVGGNALGNRIFGGSGDDSLSGDDGDDRLYGGLGFDLVNGGAGADILDGGGDADDMTGGMGDDRYYLDNSGDVIFEVDGEGYDRAFTTADYVLGAGVSVEDLNVVGTTGLRLGGNELDNRLFGGSGDDTLSGFDGADRLYGGLGNDSLNGNLGDDIMHGGQGDDTYNVDGDDVVVEGAGEGTDTVRAWVDWILEANVENLVMMGSDDLIADGNDLNNVMRGNSGWNDLYGGDGDDTLSGLAGDDLLYGDDGSDILNGGGGRDTLDGGAGADQMFGGNSDDIYVFDDLGDTATEVGGGGFDGVISSVTTTLGTYIEALFLLPTAGNIDGTGNASDNLLQGNEGNNVLSGLAGRDLLDGGEGEDILHGGDGDDFLDDGFDTDIDYLYGGAGRDALVGSAGDFLYGGIGNDSYSITEEDILVIEYANEGYDTVFSQISYTLTDNVEALDLSCAGGDIDGAGNALGNVILGNCHANVLNGMGGNDVLSGYDGDDTLIGGLGNDRLAGEIGADTFVVRNDDMISSVLGQPVQIDVILDLDFSEGDRIDLSGIDADINTDGDQDFIMVLAFSRQAGEARLTYNAASDTSLLVLDVDGDGRSDYVLKLLGDHTGGLLLDGSEPVDVGGWLGFAAP